MFYIPENVKIVLRKYNEVLVYKYSDLLFQKSDLCPWIVVEKDDSWTGVIKSHQQPEFYLNSFHSFTQIQTTY